jgi:hypothetical protein
MRVGGGHHTIPWGAKWHQQSVPHERSNFCLKSNMDKWLKPKEAPENPPLIRVSYVFGLYGAPIGGGDGIQYGLSTYQSWKHRL